jgi:putative transposase
LNLSRDERLRLIERESEELSVRIQVELLSVNRSGVYYHPQAPSEAEVQLKHRIDEIYTRMAILWITRRSRLNYSWKESRSTGKPSSAHRREMGIAGICPGPNLSKRTQKEGIFPYLLRHTTSQYPNHIWGLDITYIRVAWRLDVPGGSAGLVLPICSELGIGRARWNCPLS